MENYEYATMAGIEDYYWWYRGLHSIIVDVLRAAGVNSESRILDAGCGTGGALMNLRSGFAVEPFGFDYSPEAGRFLKRRGLQRCAVASINEMPYPANSFDAAISIDVLENEFVDQDKAMLELNRVMRPGGVLLMLLPAYRWLLSEEHHRAVHTIRRYSRPEVVALLADNGFEIVRATHLFALLLPITAAYRLLFLPTRPHADVPHSELKPLPTPINEAFVGIMRAERHLVRNFDLPFGSSILVLGKKVNS
ncbi:MAG: class I SAM-dependent methyltransferase [Chloroflexota bacterium]